MRPAGGDLREARQTCYWRSTRQSMIDKCSRTCFCQVLEGSYARRSTAGKQCSTGSAVRASRYELLIGAAKRAVLEEMDISNAISEQAAYLSGYWRFTARGG